MRASAGGYYANLMRMYRHLEIPLHPVRFLFVFSKAAAAAASRETLPSRDSRPAKGEAGTYFIHASNLHQTPPPWPGTRGILAHLAEIFYLILCHFWFSIACLLVQPRTESTEHATTGRGESLAEYLRRIWIPNRYASQYLLPLLSSVSTCSHEEMLSFPASDIVSYKKLSHGRQHYVVCGGVDQVQLRLVKDINDIRLRSRVLEVVPQVGDSDGLQVRWQTFGHDGLEDKVSEEVFDRVILAVSPDVAGRIYRPLAKPLANIPTTRVESSVLAPISAKGDAASFTVVDNQDSSSRKCMHHSGDMTAAQTITLKTRFSSHDTSRTEALHTMPSGVIVHTCPLNDIDPKRALQTAEFTRTLRNTESQALMKRIMGETSVGPPPRKDEKTGLAESEAWVNGQDNVWLAGAWCWDGMVLLEGCVVSAMRVADDFGVRTPWRAG